jgi:hypothetical protein
MRSGPFNPCGFPERLPRSRCSQLLPAGRRPIASPMFGPDVEVSVVVVMAEIPGLARQNRLPAASTGHHSLGDRLRPVSA